MSSLGMTQELAYLDATMLADRLRRGELSAVEAADAAIARIERLDGPINAVVVRRFEQARDEARRADAVRAAGRPQGPLHGVPITVKESFDVPGLPTTWGMADYRGNVADVPAASVQRLTDAGAIVLGKTNLPVGLADWQSYNPVYGTTGNPWDPTRSPGGSSGGSAAALAAGFAPLELGSDIGASIRNPAHYCGVYGHKPTWGMVPMQGHQLPGMGCIDALDIAVAGPMARSAADLELAMGLLTTPLQVFGHHGWLPLAGWHDDGRPAHRLRVAIKFNDDAAEVDAAIEQALCRLMEFLRDAGVAVEASPGPVDGHGSHDTYFALLRSGQAALLDDAHYAGVVAQAARYAPDDTGPAARHWRNQVLSHQAWQHRHQQRLALQARWAAFFERHDVLIAPIAATTAVPHNHMGTRWEQTLTVNGRPQPQITQLFWAGLPGVVGLPATAVPLGLAADGLPVGAQIIGPLFADPVCLRLARWLETEYHRFVPPPGYATA